MGKARGRPIGFAAGLAHYRKNGAASSADTASQFPAHNRGGRALLAQQITRGVDQEDP